MRNISTLNRVNLMNLSSVSLRTKGHEYLGTYKDEWEKLILGEPTSSLPDLMKDFLAIPQKRESEIAEQLLTHLNLDVIASMDFTTACRLLRTFFGSTGLSLYNSFVPVIIGAGSTSRVTPRQAYNKLNQIVIDAWQFTSEIDLARRRQIFELPPAKFKLLFNPECNLTNLFPNKFCYDRFKLAYGISNKKSDYYDLMQIYAYSQSFTVEEVYWYFRTYIHPSDFYLFLDNRSQTYLYTYFRNTYHIENFVADIRSGEYLSKHLSEKERADNLKSQEGIVIREAHPTKKVLKTGPVMKEFYGTISEKSSSSESCDSVTENLGHVMRDAYKESHWKEYLSIDMLSVNHKKTLVEPLSAAKQTKEEWLSIMLSKAITINNETRTPITH